MLTLRALTRVAVGRSTLGEEHELAEGQACADILFQRLADWAESDYDINDTAAGFDLGTAAGFAACYLKLSPRLLLDDAAQELLADLDPVAAVRVLELVNCYYNSDRQEMPDAP